MARNYVNLCQIAAPALPENTTLHFAQNDKLKRHPVRKSLVHALMASLLILSGVANAALEDELFADGNRLFRDDLYWAALLRYEQALDAGMDTPQLHYNMGVAHYRAKQYVRARKSFEKAAHDPRLAAYANYNLGLNSLALGDTNDALIWFQKARDQDQSENISTLARLAIKRVSEASIKEDAVLVRAKAEEKQRDISNFSFSAQVGGGVDDNVFRTPAEPYIDLSNPNQPLVSPIVQSGFYIPVRVLAKYSVNSFAHESFFGAYRFGGRFYQDKDLKNGDEYLHEISFGTEYERKEETRTRKLFSAFAIAQHDEQYYDRDTGGSLQVNDIDIADRLDYTRYGPEIWFRQSYERLTIGARLKGQLWNYKDTVEVPAYDHEFFLAGLSGQFQFTRTSLIRLTAEHYKRYFTDRPSYDLDGTQPIGNPAVRYDYLELGVTARQRVTSGLWFGVNYLRTDRKDRYAGYNNYVKNGYGAEIHWQMSQRFNVEASGIYEVYDYENAFAYQNPDVGRKTLERVFGQAAAIFDMTRHLSLVAEYRYDDSASNDARIAYNRGRMSLSVRWEQ